MHVTFDLSDIEETMPQQARKQLETELETTLHSFGDVGCLYTGVLVSPVQSIVQSMVQSRVQLLQSSLQAKIYQPEGHHTFWGVMYCLQYSPENNYAELKSISLVISHHVSLPCFFNVVCGDDDGCLLRGNQLQKMVPYP